MAYTCLFLLFCTQFKKPNIIMSKNLVIVESPAKAKTIGKFLGNEFEVMSSMGHIRDLSDKGLGIDKENNYATKYEV